MTQQESSLMIVHQYPHKKTTPFVNNNNKKTHLFLPKISQIRHQQNSLINIRQSIKSYMKPYSMRPCCIYKNQQLSRINDGLKKVKFNHISKKSKLFFLQKDKGNYRGDHNMSLNSVLARQKLLSQKYLRSGRRSNLNQFRYEQIGDSESKHKVVRTQASLNLSHLSIFRNTKADAEQQFQNKSPEQEIKNNLKNSYIRTFEDKQKDNYDQIEPNKQLYSPLAKYKNKIQNKDYRFHINNLNTYESNQSTQSINLFPQKVGINTKQLNTIFHSIKKQQSRNTQLDRKRTKMHSATSKGLFRIPEEDQLQEYLLNYTTMSPSFDLQGLVKESNFQIIRTENRAYFGQMQNNKRHGKCISITEREIFQGIYQNNTKKQGWQKNKDGIFIGFYSKGKRNGIGKFKWKTGQQFIGEWKQGKKHGLGTWKSPNGDYYQGQWKENKQNGQGIHYHYGVSKYKGFFKDFLKHGRGEQEFCNGDKYIGQYQNGKPHGWGRYIWSSRDQYQGQFVQGSRQGKGKLKESCGDQYVGLFKNDMKHGQGKQTLASGQIFEGEFRYGRKCFRRSPAKQILE